MNKCLLMGPLKTILFISIISSNSMIYAQEDFLTCEIATKNSTISIGEPLVVELTYHLKKPLISRTTNEKNKEIDNGLSLQIDFDSSGSAKEYRLYPFKLILQDESGLEYKGTFVLWYDYFAKKLYFDKSGKYTLQACSKKDQIFSNSIVVQVRPERYKTQEALSSLTDPDDYLFVLHGLDDYPEKREARLSRLKQVEEQSQGTILEKWIAARLGIECFNDVLNSSEKQQVKIDEAIVFLDKGIDLPDEFPIREEVVYTLASIESVNGNRERTESLKDELVRKYPHGKFAARPIMGKTPAIPMIKKSDDSRNSELTVPHNTIKVFIIIGLSTIVIGSIVIIGKMKGKIF